MEYAFDWFKGLRAIGGGRLCPAERLRSGAVAGSYELEEDGDPGTPWREGEEGGLWRGRDSRDEMGTERAAEVLAPGVENKGAVSSRVGPTVPDDEESRRGSIAPFKVLSIEEADALERGICGAQPVAFSTHGGDSATSGAGVGSDCSADCTVDPTRRRRLFILRRFGSPVRRLRFVLQVAVLACPLYAKFRFSEAHAGVCQGGHETRRDRAEHHEGCCVDREPE